MVVKRNVKPVGHLLNRRQLATNRSKSKELPSEGRGQGFESLRARHLSQWVIAPSVLEYGVAEYTPLFRPARLRRRTRVSLDRVLQTIRRRRWIKAMTTIREVFDCASWTPIASFDSERVLRALEWHLNRVLPSTFRELIALENGPGAHGSLQQL